MDNYRKKTIGPYVLDSLLGKGQTGVVRLGIHCTTKERVAVKIIDRTKLNPQILSKVEREIAIMKLIEHPHVLRLYDVYENRTHLFLILEYVGGGELFDYLVKKGRLPIRDARRFFSQIISAVDFCHKHCVCHRDLKPENLLLDEKQNIKVADFGMASLQVGDNYMLETSCGSPHYACPEVVKGIKYDGRKADIWSCGVILYALVVGVLPFDDDNLRHLLEKVKKGVFRIPDSVQSDCQQLIKEMIKVDPNKRITMKHILNHHFIKNHVEIHEQLPVQKVVSTEVILTEEDIDPDVLTCMSCLGCFHDKEKLVEKLLIQEEKNMEKVLYFLLLERKERRPCNADVVPKAIRQMSSAYFEDPPRKRVDSCGSPRLNRSLDSNVYPMHGRPRAGTDITKMNNVHRSSTPPSQNSESPGSSWWSRIPGVRRPSPGQSPVLARKKMHSSNPSLDTSPIEVKKSWFAHLPLGHTHSSYKDEPFFIVIKGKPLSTIKADVVHAFLTIPHLTHNVTSSTTFAAQYSKHKGSSVFRKVVKFDVSIVDSSRENDKDTHDFTVNMKLISGSSNKFKKLCEKIQEILLSNGRCSSPEKSQRPLSTATVSGQILEDGGCSLQQQKLPSRNSSSTNGLEKPADGGSGHSLDLSTQGSKENLLSSGNSSQVRQQKCTS